MDNATISSYKQEFFTYALTYKDLATVPFSETPVVGQKIIGVKLKTVQYFGRFDVDGSFKVREDLIELLEENGYKSEDSLLIDIGYGYDENCTCDDIDCHNMYSSFTCRDTAAGSYVKGLIQDTITSTISNELASARIDEWFLIPLLTTKHINAKTVFIVIPELANESYYSSIITI
jgi:hypothetical protein